MQQHRKDLQSFNIRPYRLKQLKHYCKYMSQDREKVIFDDNVADVLKTQGFSVTESPRSIYRAEKLYEALSKYAPINEPSLRITAEVIDGFKLARICFAKPKDRAYLRVLPFTPETISLITSEPTASAGLTAYGSTKAAAQTRALERGLQTLRQDKAPEPCLAFSRTQFEEKTRLVWGFPYSMTAVEGLVAYPLMQQFKKGTTPMAFAMTTCALGTKLRTASYHSKWAYSIDHSGYDSTIHSDLIRESFSIIKTWFDLTEIEPISGKPVGHIFNIIERYFISTPIVMPDSQLYLGKKHGVPSGSYFTQIVDSIVNVMIAGALSSKFSMHVPRTGIFVLGDDLLLWSNREMELDQMSQYVNAAFGVNMNGFPKSQRFRWDEPIQYLGRIWSKGLPSLDEESILARMVYPETFRKYSSDPEVRRREVKLLLLSYASVYYHAWPIVQRALGTDLWYAQAPERIEYSVYADQPDAMVNPDHLSGLFRYQRKYHGHDVSGRLTTAATQFWL